MGSNNKTSNQATLYTRDKTSHQPWNPSHTDRTCKWPSESTMVTFAAPARYIRDNPSMADQIPKEHSYTTSATMNTTNQDQGLKWYQTPNPVGQKVQALSLNPQIFCVSCKKRMCPRPCF